MSLSSSTMSFKKDSSKKNAPLMKPICKNLECPCRAELGDRHFLSVCQKVLKERAYQERKSKDLERRELERLELKESRQHRKELRTLNQAVTFSRDEEEHRHIVEKRRLERKAKAKAAMSDDHDDAASVTSTAPTESASTTPQVLVLTANERKELLKVEKCLRQLDDIQKRLDDGQKVDRLQVEKLQRRADLESSVVMLKINGGYRRE